ncbi:MAG: methyl-accepting chemotaxis protein [Fibrobacteria bacterium]|nr:methyl-accepting chemotaxis protein [Fibrobacteria bacterium]
MAGTNPPILAAQYPDDQPMNETSHSRRSILRRLQISMMGFGLAMGVVFPAYANFFVEWKTGMFPWFALGAVVAGITVGLANHFMVKFLLLRPLESISRVARALRSGDLRERTSLVSADDVGRIAEDLDDALNALERSMKQVGMATDQVNRAADRIETTRQSSLRSLRSLAEEAITLRAGAGENITRVHEGAAASLGMDAWNRELAASLQEDSSRLSELVSLSSRQTQEVSRLRAHSEDLNRRMEVVHRATRSIEDFLGLVQGIVKQTEILSLNASIEAVRAGQAGRGFSVVAQEIRALSRDSAAAGEKIRSEVERMRSTVQEAVATTEEILRQAQVSEEFSDTVAQSARAREASLQEKRTNVTLRNEDVERGTQSTKVGLEHLGALSRQLESMASLARTSSDETATMDRDLQDLTRQIAALRALGASFRYD